MNEADKHWLKLLEAARQFVDMATEDNRLDDSVIMFGLNELKGALDRYLYEQQMELEDGE